MKTTSLVIVESPAKARTIGKFLGGNFVVEASIGHIRDLPKNSKEIPAQYKKEKWSRLGVNINQDFEPIYVVPDDKRKQIKKLKGVNGHSTCPQLKPVHFKKGKLIAETV